MDKLLDRVFEPQRWIEALKTGQKKGIDRSILKRLCRQSERDVLKSKILKDAYEITPPHEAQIPKENGEFRTVYVNTGLDRILLTICIDYATGNNWRDKTYTNPNKQPVSNQVQDTKNKSYVLNTHTMKIRLPNCPSVNKIAEYNRQNYTGDIKDLLSQGYSSCGYCHPN
jgi:hypothetical protein